jgi:tetratricopeptide (TPR) repeat protein
VTRFLLGLIESADPRSAPGDTTVGRAILRLGLARVEELHDQPVLQADVIDALGKVLGSLGQNERATELHERALGLRRTALGPEHPEVAPSLMALGNAMLRRSRYAEAEAYYREALRLQHAAWGDDDPRVGETVSELAFLMPYLGREQAAESLYAVARDILVRTLGAADRRTLVVRQRLAARYRLYDLPRAEREMRLVLADSRRSLGEDDPFTAVTMFHIGDYVARQRPDDPEAEQRFRDGIAALDRRLGPRNLDEIHGLNSLADLLMRRHRYRESEALLRRSLEINEALLGADHVGTAGAVAHIGWLYENEGRLQDAERWRTEALARYERALGPEHGTVAQARVSLARLAAKQHDYARAERLWREAIAGLEGAYGPGNMATVRSRLAFAGTLFAIGKADEARRLCADGVANLVQTLPPEHVVLADIRTETPWCEWNGADR